MLKSYVAGLRSKSKKPGFTFLILGFLWNAIVLLRKKPFFPVWRFFVANRLPSNTRKITPSDNRNVEILFVTAGKDIKMLEYSIPAARKSVFSFDRVPHVQLIVPNNDLHRAREIAGLIEEVSVSCEDEFVSAADVEKLRIRFGDRFGWALQQILKVSFVLQSESRGVMIVDADTVLLEPRAWLSAEGVQVLTPSDEFNSSYYDFLSASKLSLLKPKFTFVSHHMLMQPHLLKEAYLHAGWDTVSKLVEKLCDYAFLNSASPFCIEYEAYAQYLLEHYPEKVILSKWANLGISRKRDLDSQILSDVERYSELYSSLSFHSYL